MSNPAVSPLSSRATNTAQMEDTTTGASVASEVGADHEFERVERPGERRLERRRDAAGRAAPHQQPQVVAAHAEGAADARADGGG